MGGPHATALPKEALSNSIDIVFLGESELSFVKFLNNLPALLRDIKSQSSEAQLKKIKGLSFILNNNTIFSTKKNDRIECLDLIPFPARHYFKYPEKYQTAFRAFPGTSARIMTSRGCQEKCVFCDRQTFGRTITFRSSESIMSEVHYLENRFGKIKQIDFIDENLLFDPENIKKIAGEVYRQFKIKWGAGNTRIDCDVDENYFRTMHKYGCYRISFGVESGSQRVINKLNKRIDLSQVEKVITMANNANLFTAAFFIIGNHCEDESDIKKTLSLAKNLTCDAVQFNFNTPYPGTPLWNYASKRGLLKHQDWEQYGENENMVFNHEKVSDKELLMYYKKGYRDFYLRPKFIVRQLRKILKTKGKYWFLYYNGLYQILGRYRLSKTFTKKKI